MSIKDPKQKALLEKFAFSFGQESAPFEQAAGASGIGQQLQAFLGPQGAQVLLMTYEADYASVHAFSSADELPADSGVLSYAIRLKQGQIMNVE